MKPANWSGSLILTGILLTINQGFCQSPADSIRLFQKPAVKVPAVQLTGIEQFRITFQPAGLLSPEIRLFGPSDLLPVFRPAFLPDGDWWISASASPDGSLSGDYFMNFPNGAHLMTLYAGTDWVKELNYNGSQQSGLIRMGNRQTGMGSRLPDWYYLFQADFTRRGLDWTTDKKPVVSQWSGAGIRFFSDQDAGADDWSAGGVIRFNSQETHKLFAPAFGKVTASWNPDLTIGTWLNTGEWEVGSGDLSDFQAGSAFSGLQFSGDYAEFSASIGFSQFIDSTSSAVYPAGSVKTSIHGIHWHLILEGGVNSTANLIDEIANSNFWYLDYSSLPPFYRKNYSGTISLEWIPDHQRLWNLGIQVIDQSDYFLVTDSVLSAYGTLTKADFRFGSQDRFSYDILVETEIIASIPIGNSQSLPWLPQVVTGISGTGFYGEIKVSAGYKWLTERYEDTKKQKKMPDLHEISLLLEDFRWKSLNLFAEFKIIRYEAGETLPGLQPETFRLMTGIRYHF